MGVLPPQIANIFQINATQTASIMSWIGFGLVFLIIIGFFVTLFYFMTFRYSVTIYPLVGSGNKNELAVGKKKWNRFRWNKKKTSWQSLLPLFNKKQIEPFDPKYIYQGRHIVAFKLGDQYIPGCLNINVIENENIKAEINPVPHYIRNWQSNEHKKNAVEFAKHDFWNDNKMMIMVLICAGICLAMVLGTAYLTYKMTGINAQSWDALTSTINNFGNIGGAPPG